MIWQDSPELISIIEKLKSSSTLSVSGLSDGAYAALVSELADHLNYNLLFIVPRESEFNYWGDIISSFTDRNPVFFPHDYPTKQIEAVKSLQNSSPAIIIGGPETLNEQLCAPAEFQSQIVNLVAGINRYDEIYEALLNGKYVRRDVVAEPGDFARRGEVIDYWSPSDEHPVRMQFENDTLEKIKIFDSVNQLSISERDTVQLLPAQISYSGKSSLSDYLPKSTLIAVNDELYFKLEISAISSPLKLVKAELSAANLSFNMTTLAYSQSFTDIKNEVLELLNKNYKITLTAPYQNEVDKLIDLFRDEISMELTGFESKLREGFIIESIKTAVLTISDIFPSHRGHVSPSLLPSLPMEEFSDLKVGDLIVHRRFGIGIYQGIKQIQHGSSKTDFLMLKYANTGKLYVAVENADVIERYAGDLETKRLDSLSGSSWKNTTSKVRASVKNISNQILQVYKDRSRKGFSFISYPDLEEEFASHFPYRLTAHQKDAISEVLKDMESDTAMDRLVCGDVGYGKTEVAMRAAFRAVANGKQVVLLAPTTVLAHQHFNTFRQRFSQSPVIIDMLSRLVKNSEQKETLTRIKEGRTDIIIGTHRLLSNDIHFPSLGLIIVDEEQRFGVEQKEKLSYRYKAVDILTTTATPIPRTLAMAFGKVKGFSLINTPPAGRIGITTQTMPLDMEAVKHAISYEVARGGQCYYVHSRVRSITGVKTDLERELPTVKFCYIHGKMDASKIERVLTDFIDGKYDCLISTTIIENGIDIPNVNTMIIDYAHRLGLADIYQLRGRIGRSNIRAYCYLMYPKKMELSESVKGRLSALSAFSGMGGGFQLALRDMQIRGAGELLGSQQHGNIMKVGFDYYLSILKEELARMKGEDYVDIIEVDISLPIDAFIAEDYMESSDLRLAFYRRLSSLSSLPELNKIKAEMKDRFGKFPPELNNLFKIIEIKILASHAKIIAVSLSGSKLKLKLSSGELLEREIESNNFFVAIKIEINALKKLFSEK